MDVKKFYKEIGKTKKEVKEPPKTEEKEEFCKKIRNNKKEYNAEAHWTKLSWKTSGLERIPNFWLNCLTEVHRNFDASLTGVIQNPEQIPAWMTEGTAYLLSKTEDAKNPKILTSILTDRIYAVHEQRSIFPPAQKGCKKEFLWVQRSITHKQNDCRELPSKQKIPSMAWTDYRKAFDSVPHNWILKASEIYKISPVISKFLQSSMAKWNKRLLLNHSNGMSQTNNINIKRGIFQGDSLSPLLSSTWTGRQENY
eukprot:XP_014772363.1 PREDICTED: uncharacterized protein LOC106870709 [Octopus bimaculoides]